MSFEIEHIWIAKKELPVTIHGMFPDGACTVWANMEFTAAIPATNDDTNELADLFEMGAESEPCSFDAYFKRRDELCQPQGYQILSAVWKQEMDKLRKKQMLASAARLN